MRMQRQWTALVAVVVTLGVLALVASRSMERAGLPTTLDKHVTSDRYRFGTSTLPAAIDIVGRVVDHGTATTGTVTVRVGSQETQTQTSFTPNFTVTVSGSRPQDMVLIEVQGQGFKYVSLLGSYGKLVRQAGSDRVLTIEESDALRVSPISTALQFFASLSLAGPPASDSQFERAMRTLRTDDLGTASILLAAWAKGQQPLPVGHANGYDVLQDQEAYRAFLQGRPEALYQYGDDLDAMSSAAFAGIPIAGPVALVGAMADLDAPINPPDIQILERTSSGYKVHSSASRRNAGFSGGLDTNGNLLLVPDSDISSYTYLGLCSTGVQILERRRLVSESYRRQLKGDRVSLWLVVREYERSYTNCADLPPATYRMVEFRNALNLDQGYNPRDARRYLGARALPDFCIIASSVPGYSYIKACEYATHQFLPNGTGSMSELGEKVDAFMLPVSPNATASFVWSLSARGVLQMDDGEVATRYWMVDYGNPAVQGLAYVAEAEDDGDTLSLAGYVGMVNGNVARGFESLPPVGTWRYATSEQYIEPYAYSSNTAAQDTRFVRFADGRAMRLSTIDHYPTLEFEVPSRWMLFGPRLYDTRVMTSQGGAYHDCEQASAAGESECGPFTVRVFRPMSRVGNRLYGVEDLYGNYDNYRVPAQLYRTSRPNFHELQ